MDVRDGLIKKAEHWRIDDFELWSWRRPLRVPWTARRSNQSILKISPGCSLEGLMLKLKLQYFGHLMWRADSFEKTLMLGKIEGMRRRGWQRMRWLDGITDSMDMSLGRLRELVMDRRPGVLWFMVLQRVGQDWATELNWTLPPGPSSELLIRFHSRAPEPKGVYLVEQQRSGDDRVWKINLEELSIMTEHLSCGVITRVNSPIKD